jgi:hypothetical protein
VSRTDVRTRARRARRMMGPTPHSLLPPRRRNELLLAVTSQGRSSARGEVRESDADERAAHSLQVGIAYNFLPQTWCTSRRCCHLLSVIVVFQYCSTHPRVKCSRGRRAQRPASTRLAANICWFQHESTCASRFLTSNSEQNRSGHHSSNLGIPKVRDASQRSMCGGPAVDGLGQRTTCARATDVAQIAHPSMAGAGVGRLLCAGAWIRVEL